MNEKLFEKGTMKQTKRLRQLLNNEINPTRADITELWSTCYGSKFFTGVHPSLKDFAEWIRGGAEVTW